MQENIFENSQGIWGNNKVKSIKCKELFTYFLKNCQAMGMCKDVFQNTLTLATFPKNLGNVFIKTSETTTRVLTENMKTFSKVKRARKL